MITNILHIFYFRFAVMLTLAACFFKAWAVDYILPTEIPASYSDRLRLIAALDSNSSSEYKKAAYLTQLALLASSSEARVEEVVALEEHLKQLREQLNDDAELDAALGSTISYKSSFYTNEFSKLALFSRTGNRIMDRAVKQSPFNLGARLQRGISCANMPAFLRRAHYAVEDLEMVRQKIGRKFGKEFLALVEFNLAQAYSRNRQKEEARLLWQKLTTSETDWAQKSRLALEVLSK